ncbi:hypothetical protein [Phyllobacterium sp. SB3]|uniref:hypothetical protein n=1 Tax=Phyllobacterium sp. SB3 TaxID=3156073 RepID=UPI0032AFFC4F
MAYTAVVEARKAAEMNQDKVREAVRLGLQLKRETEAKKAAKEQVRVQTQARR